jgi:hypothetical protein
MVTEKEASSGDDLLLVTVRMAHYRVCIVISTPGPLGTRQKSHPLLAVLFTVVTYVIWLSLM